MKIMESAEDYLETIYILGKSNEHVRSVDIAHELEYTKPSVSVAMKNLRQNGYIEVYNGDITLTQAGLEIAENIYKRHELITGWLVLLGVSKDTAASDACKMEHGISEESYAAINKHIEEWKQLKNQNIDKSHNL